MKFPLVKAVDKVFVNPKFNTAHKVVKYLPSGSFKIVFLFYAFIAIASFFILQQIDFHIVLKQILIGISC